MSGGRILWSLAVVTSLWVFYMRPGSGSLDDQQPQVPYGGTPRLPGTSLGAAALEHSSLFAHTPLLPPLPWEEAN